jgi:hypothetical protein
VLIRLLGEGHFEIAAPRSVANIFGHPAKEPKRGNAHQHGCGEQDLILANDDTASKSMQKNTNDSD